MAESAAAVVDALRMQVPSGVVVSASVGTAPGPFGDRPTQALRSTESRSARDCAGAALAMLGQRSADIPTGEGGQPVWPTGFVGSLSHCPGFTIAAVGRVGVASAIGIDVEVHRPVRPAVAATIVCGSETSMLTRLASSHPAVAWSAVLWSVKESVFKAWYPLTGRWVDYTACEVVIHPDRGSFDARVLAPAGPTECSTMPRAFAGRWSVVGTHLCSVVIVPASQRQDG
ncbi:4'-phosphopantetheinyl transferase family protein [Plantibacter cousiniae (nom. nud.)]|uniref:4'-phosphopantetheinyl transferase family protein n=1 Tax=Plantibacter cousiniae (nom. nud.) TaxID=199709 RepID=UPI0009A79977|nr:4'-phosphopantetheinyl transferase superfamily protein [Plantibacter cousiniae]